MTHPRKIVDVIGAMLARIPTDSNSGTVAHEIRQDLLQWRDFSENCAPEEMQSVWYHVGGDVRYRIVRIDMDKRLPWQQAVLDIFTGKADT